MHKNFLLCILLFFFCVTTLSAANINSETIVYKKTGEGISFRVLHREGGQWFEDLFYKRKGDWQEFISSRSIEFSKVNARVQEYSRSGWTQELDSELQEILYSEAAPSRSLSLWNSEEEWSWEWELKFSKWIAEDFDKDFLLRHELPTDCADLVYAARFIFARIHKLAIGFTLGGTSQLFTHDTVPSSLAQYSTHEDWTQDKRFRKALDYLHNATYTHTLFKDSYPIEVSKESIIPGSYIVTLSETSGHTRMLKNVAKDQEEIALNGPMTYYWSNVPRIVRRLYVSGFWDGGRYKKDKAAFLRLKSISRVNSVWRFKKAEDSPTYSLMQYEDEFMGERKMFFAAVYDRLFEKVEWDKVLVKIFQDIIESLEARKIIVEEGFELCQKENCAPGTENYENYSTPSRDTRLTELMSTARQVSSAFQVDFPAIKEFWDEKMKTSMLEVEEYPLYFDPVIFALYNRAMSFDPRHSVAKRWGVSEIPTLEATQDCVSENNGVDATYYATPANVNSWPNFSLLNPYASDVWPKIFHNWGNKEIAGSKRKDYVAVLLKTYVSVPEDGILDFQVVHDDGLELFLDSKELTFRPFGFYSNVAQKVKAGLHQLLMRYVEYEGNAQLKLYQRDLSGVYVPVPEKAYFRACAP